MSLQKNPINPSTMNGGSLLLLGLTGPELTAEEAERFRRLQPAGYILFSRNVITPEQTRKLTDDLRDLSYDLPIIAIDQEGGRVTRTKDIAPAIPSAPALAAKQDYGLIADAAVHTADLLRLLGCNMNFAPVLDLDHFPEKQNALRGRCWGQNDQDVINFAGHWNRWLRKRHMTSCSKHFPAGGRAQSDPHHDLPSCDANINDLMKQDVIPYTALMPEIDAIMLAHIEFPNIDPQLPASLSPRIIRQFLRDQLGFEKQLVLTDDLDMGAIASRYGRGEDAKLAIEAGNDLAMICHKPETADEAAEAINSLPQWMIDEALKRIDRVRRKKLRAPLAWSSEQWQKTCDALEAVSREVPEDHDAPPQSPVEDY